MDGEPIQSSLPKTQLSMVIAWVAIHRSELEVAWIKASKNEKIEKIKPLKLGRKQMYIKDGIAYADDFTPILKITGAEILDDRNMLLQFSNGEKLILMVSSWFERFLNYHYINNSISHF